MKAFFKRYLYTVLFIIILLIASTLRIYDLGNLPSGFHNDEASFFLNAQSILATGKDEDNHFLPIYLTSYIDPKPALYSYLQIPSILMFGESYFAARLPAAVLGLISLVLSYLLLRRLFTKNIALLGMMLLAISPWHIMISRATQEVILSFTFGLAAVVLLFYALDNKKKMLVFYIATFLCAFISMYAYHSAKIFMPIILVSILVYAVAKKKLSIKKSLVTIVGVITITGMVVFAGGFDRYNAVGIFGSPSVQLILDEQIRTATGHADLTAIRLFTNKLFSYAFAIMRNYGEHFSLSFLFIDGGEPNRYLIPFHGLFYAFEIVLILIGIAYGLSQKKYRAPTTFLVLWLLAAPIPGAITTLEVPSVIRVFPMIIPLIAFISLGLFALVTFSYKRTEYRYAVCAVLAMLYIGGFGYFWFQFTIQQPNYHPWNRFYGAERLPEKVKQYMGNYDEMQIGSNQYVYFALHDMISINELQESYPKRLQKEARFGKLVFNESGCKIFPPERKILFVLKADCAERVQKIEGIKKIDQVDFKDGNPEYIFYEIMPPDSKNIVGTASKS